MRGGVPSVRGSECRVRLDRFSADSWSLTDDALKLRDAVLNLIGETFEVHCGPLEAER